MTRQSSPPSSSESSTKTPWVSCHVYKRRGFPRNLMPFIRSTSQIRVRQVGARVQERSRDVPSTVLLKLFFFPFITQALPHTSSLPFNWPLKHLFSPTLDKKAVQFISRIRTLNKFTRQDWDNPHWSSRCLINARFPKQLSEHWHLHRASSAFTENIKKYPRRKFSSDFLSFGPGENTNARERENYLHDVSVDSCLTCNR